MTSFDLERTYLFLDGKGVVESADGGPAFWAGVGEKSVAGDTMVIVDADKGDWARWEMHPRGDEILVILEGTPVIFLEHADGRLERRATRPGETLIVPRGSWHRAEGVG
ncbi:MAG: cupin domain-containing protein, partial [Caulobacteraceae bacterium]